MPMKMNKTITCVAEEFLWLEVHVLGVRNHNETLNGFINALIR